MKAYEIPDWRIAKAARVEIATGSPNGPKPGDLVVLLSVVGSSELGEMSFATPSPPRLALNASMWAAANAMMLRARLRLEHPPGAHNVVDMRDLEILYDHFESCMVAVTFAYQSLESFANQIIADQLKGTFSLTRRKKKKAFSASELERVASTSEKLGVVLPQLYRKPTPKGTKVWQNLVELQHLRDSTIHLKSTDYYNKARPDRETLFFRFINLDAFTAPTYSLAMIRYFEPSSTWVEAAEEGLVAAKNHAAKWSKGWRRVWNTFADYRRRRQIRNRMIANAA